MRTFAIVAVRLVGLWLIAGALPGFVILLMNIFEGASLSEMWGDRWAYQAGLLAGPVVVGLGLIVFSRPVAALLSRGVSADASDALTVREFTRAGVFLLGLYSVLRGLPLVLVDIFGGMTVGLSDWLLCGFGLVLLAAASRLGGLINHFNN